MLKQLEAEVMSLGGERSLQSFSRQLATFKQALSLLTIPQQTAIRPQLHLIPGTPMIAYGELTDCMGGAREAHYIFSSHLRADQARVSTAVLQCYKNEMQLTRQSMRCTVNMA